MNNGILHLGKIKYCILLREYYSSESACTQCFGNQRMEGILKSSGELYLDLGFPLPSGLGCWATETLPHLSLGLVFYRCWHQHWKMWVPLDLAESLLLSPLEPCK